MQRCLGQNSERQQMTSVLKFQKQRNTPTSQNNTAENILDTSSTTQKSQIRYPANIITNASDKIMTAPT